jgi:ferredoxin
LKRGHGFGNIPRNPRQWQRGRRGYVRAGWGVFFSVPPLTCGPLRVSPKLNFRDRRLDTLQEQKRSIQARIGTVMKRLDELTRRETAPHLAVRAQEAYVFHEICTGCGACVESCPHGAITLSVRAEIEPSLCTGCGVCVTKCPQRAIILGQRPNMARLDDDASHNGLGGVWSGDQTDRYQF